MKIKHLAVVILVLALAFQITGCNIVDERFVASVGGEKISLSEYKFYLESVKAEMLKEANPEDEKAFWETTEVDGNMAQDVARERALEQAISNKVLALKAKEEGIMLTQEEKREISTQIKSIGTLEEELKRIGMTQAQYQTLYEESFFISKLYSKMTEEENEALALSDEEIVAYYEENRSIFKAGESTIKQIMFLLTDPDGNPLDEDSQNATFDKAQAALDRINAGENFDSVMNEVSQDPNLAKNRNGFTVSSENADMDQSILSTALSLEEGDASGIIPSETALYILKSVGVKMETLDNEDVLNYIKNTLRQEKFQNLSKQWMLEYSIEKQENMIKKVSII